MIRRILTTYFHSADAELALELRIAYAAEFKCSLNTIHDAYSVPAQHYKRLCGLYKKKAKELIFNKPLSSKLDLSDPRLAKYKLELMDIEEEIQKCKESPAWLELDANSGYPLYPE